jgi:adenylyltransferase/sulfurtransferase
VGVVAPVVQVTAGVQGAEALKLLTGQTDALLPGLLTVDLWAGTFDVAGLQGREPWCPTCAEDRYDYATAEAPSSSILCGRNAVQLRSDGVVDLPGLAARLRSVGDVVENEHLVRLRSPEAELVVFADGRAIVKGVADAAGARSVYARYVGA